MKQEYVKNKRIDPIISFNEKGVILRNPTKKSQRRSSNRIIFKKKTTRQEISHTEKEQQKHPEKEKFPRLLNNQFFVKSERTSFYAHMHVHNFYQNKF